MSNPTNTQPLIKDLTRPPRARSLAGVRDQTGPDLATAIAGNKKLHAQHQKLAQYVHAIFNGSHLRRRSSRRFWTRVKKILTDGGVAADDVAKVISDLKTIATETK